ncbi:ion transporter [Candidatus Poribacteria bacterium]|jgi:voltage-gated potassium channel|nr:ion transporter [Candidatus Poribacteria bacterium]MBT5536688.1 ion transporter [Candidatus Poribacteria bacterium]MBT5710554.1 ion transporter [Candidatus Poribacteria bacterium]MBT7100840.1 ion transporter [Candidatus Poribacteria bacterium]MBT7805184.1 ion transporter [Candidatus Poribacteria bacterium]
MDADRTGVPVRVGIDRLLHDAFGDDRCKLYRAVQRTVILVILYATGLMAFESVSVFQVQFPGFFRISEAVVVGVLLIDYAGKVYVASSRRKYILSAWGIIDLLSVAISRLFIPWLDLRMLKIVRVLKLLKLVADDCAEIRDRGPGGLRVGLRAYLTGMFVVLMVGSTLVYYAESVVHDTAFRHIPEAMWWGIGAITPLESGMSPITIVGRLIATVTSVCGLALFAFLIHIVSNTLARGGSDD